MEGESSGGFTTDPNNPDVMVSLFEDSIENHFRAMDTISKLCGEKEENEASYASDEKFSSAITFLREWKHYCYKPRTVRFTCEVENPQGKDVLNALVLPQFSAASVPKLGGLSSDQPYLKASKDSVMYVGGPVWALDWCPSVHQRSDSPIKCEYLAVAAHPPESSYHKIGVPLTGRGVVQVWCLLNANLKEEDLLPVMKKTERRGRPRKNAAVEEKCDLLDKGRDGISPPPKKAKGRPRKKVEESIGDLDSNICFHQALVHLDKESEKISPPPLKKARGRPRKKTVIEECIVDLDDNDQSVQAHTAQLDKGTKKISLSLEKARGGLRKKMLAEECTGDSDTNAHLVQAPPVQLDKGIENVSLPLESASGRQGKKPVIEESIGDLDGNRQFVQALVVQLDNTIEEISPPLKKARGRPRKKKGVKRTHPVLDIDDQTVPALAVEFPEEQAGIPSETGQLKIYHEQEVLKSPDTDVEFERETQQGFSDTEVACKSGHNILRLEEDKAKTVICHEVLKSPDTDVELGRETQQDFKLACKPGHNIPRPNRKAKDRARAWIELQINDDGGEVEGEKQPCLNSTEVAYQPGESIRQPKKKMKNKSRAGNCLDDIHPHFLSKHAEKESPIAVVQVAKSCDQDPMPSSQTAVKGLSLDTNTPNFHLPKEVALPRIVLCLAHNGKVAWDVKWRPSSMDDKRCMGYLAVLLGNGSLEVWEVPFPGTIKVLYSSYKRENTDPRFVKLAPVFRCSKLKCGDRQSIPLTLEWSPSAPHDLILAGCHDGTVALWKFSPSGSSQVADTRPLLYFTADTVPIRALAWAPNESDAESVNVIVTAGHGSVRFWDLRDPYHPLWELNPGGRRGVYSLDWLLDPRCIIMSFDDGTVRFLSMSNSANDVPVTGKPFDGTQQQGLHSYSCSSFPIWSIQASKLAGLVAYSTADGSVLRFQLTSKAVDKDPSRNRAPHFLCASLTAEEDSTIEINTPLPNTPYPMKKSSNECGDTPRSMRRFLSDSNQAKRTHDQTSDEPNLALCYGDDPLFSGSGDTTPLGMQKTKSASKPKVPRKKTSTLDMVCSYGEETETLQREENRKDEKGNEIEAFPSKLVAMHRVRWNMNKGSERWLCYGGAAGIVRCQEFSANTIKECALIKR